MANDWRPSTWGDEVTLEYGKAIRGYSQTHGKYIVFSARMAPLAGHPMH